MAHLDLLKTISLPVYCDGSLVKDSQGKVIATATDSFVASAMAQLINFGEDGAKALNESYEARQAGIAKLLKRIHK